MSDSPAPQFIFEGIGDMALPNHVVKLLRAPFSRKNFVMFGHEENEKARKNRAPNPR